MFRKLRNKIMFGVALVSLIPFLAAGFFVLYLINQAHNNDVASIERNLLDQKSIEVQQYISDSLDQLSIILPLPSDYLIRYLRPTEAIAGVPVQTLSNGDRIAFGINPPSQLDEVLQNALATNHSFKELYFIDRRTGLEVAYQSNEASGTYQGDLFADFSNLPQVQAINNGATGYVGPVDFTLNGPVVEVAAPVKNASGTLVGVLAGELDISGIKKIFTGTALGNSGYIYLVGPEGDMLYSSNAVQAPSAADVARVMQTFNPGNMRQITYNNAQGQPVVASALAIMIPGSKDSWQLVAEWPTADANQVINNLEKELAIFFILMFALTVLVSLFLANLIVRPIDSLRAGAERIATGAFDTPVTIKTHDELEDLGDAFNTMMAGLKRLQELKDEFVFIAAHELRTPVSAMKGYLELLMAGTVGSVDDAGKAFIKKVIDANKQLIQLVNDLLQVARSDAGRLTIQVAPTDLAAPIQSTLEELKPLADEKSIVMGFATGGALTVMADPGRLKEVIVNLVGNAIKYSGNGGTVNVTTEKEGNRAIVRVKDTGFGIAKEAQEKLFEKFYRVQTDKTRNVTGTGLGLFIVKQIIEKMGGEIRVESEEGKGSTFIFSLPLAV